MADERFHKNTGPYKIAEIADIGKCTYDPAHAETVIHNIASLQDGGTGDLSFLDNVKYKKYLAGAKVTACIMHPDMAGDAPQGMICLLSEKPYMAYARIATHFYPNPALLATETTIHPSAVISKTAAIGKQVIIEANTVIGDGVSIGDRCHIGANVTVTHAIIENDVRIHNGVRIGQDGFGFALDPAGFIPVPQLGRVLIGNHVNIGANSCIDRGAGPDTVIGAGTIIDNLVQIGHNVQIGKGCVIVSQVGISGSTKIGDYCVLGGQAGVAGHLNIGQGVQIGAQSGVAKDIPAGEKVMGFPARPVKEFWRDMARTKKLLSK